MNKEYFLWFTLLSAGVYGFFISIDMFTMFMFYEVALIPMYLLIGVWGTGPKEYAAMKLTLMLMGGSAFLMCGIFGIFYGAGGQTMDILDIAHQQNGAHLIDIAQQHIWFPLTFAGFGVLGALFPFHTWSPDGHASAPTAVSMLLPYRHVPHATGSTGLRLDFPRTNGYLSCLWCLLSLCSNRLKVYQCLLFSVSLRLGALRHSDGEPSSGYWCSLADAFSRSDYGSLLCPHWYDLWPHAYA